MALAVPWKESVRISMIIQCHYVTDVSTSVDIGYTFFHGSLVFIPLSDFKQKKHNTYHDVEVYRTGLNILDVSCRKNGSYLCPPEYNIECGHVLCHLDIAYQLYNQRGHPTHPKTKNRHSSITGNIGNVQ